MLILVNNTKGPNRLTAPAGDAHRAADICESPAKHTPHLLQAQAGERFWPGQASRAKSQNLCPPKPTAARAAHRCGLVGFGGFWWASAQKTGKNALQFYS